LWQVSDGLRVCARPPPEAKRWMSHATCSLRRAARTFRDRALAWLNKLTRSSLAALALGSPAGLRLERSASSLASPGRTRSSKMRGGREDESGVAPRVWAAAGSLAMASATTPSAAMGVSKSDRETVLTLTADEADEQVLAGQAPRKVWRSGSGMQARKVWGAGRVAMHAMRPAPEPAVRAARQLGWRVLMHWR